MMVPQVKTNLKMNDILALGVRLPQYNISTGSGWPYKWTTGLINKVSYVFPAGLAVNTTMLHQEVFGQTDYVPSATVNAISNEIVARIGAARKANEIKNEKEGESKPDDNVNVPEKPGDTDSGTVEPTEPTEPADPGTNEPTEPTEPANPGTDEPAEPVDPGAGSVDTGTDNPPAADAASSGGGSSQGTRSGEEAA